MTLVLDENIGCYEEKKIFCFLLLISMIKHINAAFAAHQWKCLIKN